MSMAGYFSSRVSSGPVGNSVYNELTRDFQATMRASKRVLGEQHVMSVICLHASLCPTERMSGKMVWNQFELLTLEQRTDLLQALRTHTL